MSLRQLYLHSILILFLVSLISCRQEFVFEQAAQTEQQAKIDPDYQDITIPPNIAPLNFIIQEDGEAFHVNVSGTTQSINVSSADGAIRFPMKKWKKLLDETKGGMLTYRIAVKKNGEWQQFKSFTNRVAQENIDSHLAYRLINPAFKYWSKMGIYQRNLETFDEKPIITNKLTEGNCMNCHNFNWNDPDNMVFHMRAGTGSGTYVSVNGEWKKVNLKTEFNKGGAYPSWHPDGKKIAFSVNSLTMFYHSIGESRDVLDRNSDLVLYDVETNMISTGPPIADPERIETFPGWSADGRYLYFAAANPLNDYIDPNTQDLAYDKIRFDLMRAEYDAATDTWGALETVVSSEESGKSAIMPRPSPDGKYVLFSMSDYGSFTIYHRQSDLYMLDSSGDYKRLDINSDEVDSFHSWSSNSRWFVFTSKRRDGVFGRPFFAHIDEAGVISKPFVLPQKHPNFYSTFLLNYNVPELVNGPIKVNPQKLAKVAYDNDKLVRAKLDPRVQPKKKMDNEEIDALYQARPNG